MTKYKNIEYNGSYQLHFIIYNYILLLSMIISGTYEFMIAIAVSILD